MDIHARILALASRLSGVTEFGSGGMMRQSRKVASLARLNSPAHTDNAWNASLRLRDRFIASRLRASAAPVIGGFSERQAMAVATEKKVRGYVGRLGLKRPE